MCPPNYLCKKETLFDFFYRPMALISKKMNEQKIRNWSRKHFWWWQLINCCWPYIMSDLDVGRWLESKQRKFNCVLIKVSFGIERQGLSNAFSWVIAVILQILHRCQNCTKITSKRIIWIFALKLFSTSFGKEFSKKIVKLTDLCKSLFNLTNLFHIKISNSDLIFWFWK